ncbi:MAG: GDP-mannose 4,6-dehydratase [Candidatus Woesearchaeota archaeon]
MYIKRKHQKQFELISAEGKVYWKGGEARTNAIWSGNSTKYFFLPHLNNHYVKNINKIPMDIWLEFLGYYLSEGCVHVYYKKQAINSKRYLSDIHNILIAQDPRNHANRAKIANCLRKLPFNFFSSDDHQFRIVSKQLGTYLLQFGKSSDKYVPVEVKNLSSRQLKIFFDAIMLGDGNKNKTKYYTKSKKLADDIQEIALKIGLCGHVAKVKNRDIYVVNIRYRGVSRTKKDFLTPKYPTPSKIRYNNFVYCVEVPNHIIYVRRNGKAIWCGNCYDESKRFAEALLMAYHMIHNVDIRIVRIFNTFGPRMRPNDGRAIPTFISQALRNEQITVFGDGKQTRSFCYVSDLIDGIYKLLMSDVTEPVNIGNPQEMTLLDLAKTIIKVTSSTSEIVFKPLPVDDPKVRRPDITKARTELGWEPKKKLEEGLLRTVEAFRNS